LSSSRCRNVCLLAIAVRMGNCFTTNVPTRVQLTHLLTNNQSTTKQTNVNLIDLDTDIEYREIEHSMTHNSHLNPAIPSNNSSPKHRPIKANQMIYGNLHHMTPAGNPPNTDYAKINTDLQRQIDILKQCSNDEIKMLKSRIQLLEKQLDKMSHSKHLLHSPHDEADDDYKAEAMHTAKCTKDTPTKSCPHILRLIQVSQKYNEIIQTQQQHNELEIWSALHVQHQRQYNLTSLVEDYGHMLDVHCKNNNLFELRVVFLDIYDILDSQCSQTQCECIDVITNTPFNASSSLYLLSLIHCYLYHAYSKHSDKNSDDALQRIRDHVLDKNDKLIEYQQNSETELDFSKIDVAKLSITTNEFDNISNSHSHHANQQKRIYSQTPPILLTQHSRQMITSIGDIPVDPTDANMNSQFMQSHSNNLLIAGAVPQVRARHGSVHSIVSNVSNGSASKSSQSISRLSSLSRSGKNQHRGSKANTEPESPVLIINGGTQRKAKPSAIEMSEERVRRLSGGQLNEERLRDLIDAYDRDQNIHVELDKHDHEIIHPSSSDAPDEDERTQRRERGDRHSEDEEDEDDIASNSLSEQELAEIERVKMEQQQMNHVQVNGNGHTEKTRRGSKHNLMRLQQGNDWDVDTMNQTAQDMKKQLLHLALTSNHIEQ